MRPQRGEREGSSFRVGRRLLVAALITPAVLVAGAWQFGEVSASEEFRACVLDKKTTGLNTSSGNIASLRHTLIIQNPDASRSQDLLSTGQTALEIKQQVVVGDEVTFAVTVEFNSFAALMTPAAGQEYAEKRVKEISRTAVINLDDPEAGNDSEKVTFEGTQHGCELPPPIPLV